MENTAKLAVLIDADNAKPSTLEEPLAEVAKYGTAHVKRAYGDWTGTQMKGWKDQLLAQSIQPIQQFVYTIGKNATAPAGRTAGKAKPTARATAVKLKSDTALVNLPRHAVEADSDDGWARLANVDHIITKQRSHFDSRAYGYTKLSDLLVATALFEMDRRTPGGGKATAIYARDKRHTGNGPKRAMPEG